jgi:hypothetical protein
MATHLNNTSLTIDKHKIGYGHQSKTILHLPLINTKSAMVIHLINISFIIDKHKISYGHPSKQYFTHH